jgi:serpin B
LGIRKGLSFLPEYRDRVATFYRGETAQIDFRGSDSKAREVMNAWMEARTEGKIDSLIRPEDLSPDTEMVLANALSFREDWAQRFNRDRTAPCPFQVEPGRTVQASMMAQKGRFLYFEGDGVKVLRLPFAATGRSMIVILPDRADGFAALEQQLSPSGVKSWADRLRQEDVNVFLPRFMMNSRWTMEAILSSLGMPAAFSKASADFSGITGARGLFLDRVLHQVILQIDEEGVEAAAGTALTLKKGGSVLFRADHPFLFLIRDDDSGNVLFLGRCGNPAGD